MSRGARKKAQRKGLADGVVESSPFGTPRLHLYDRIVALSAAWSPRLILVTSWRTSWLALMPANSHRQAASCARAGAQTRWGRHIDQRQAQLIRGLIAAR
jgi:hypothetical protein